MRLDGTLDLLLNLHAGYIGRRGNLCTGFCLRKNLSAFPVIQRTGGAPKKFSCAPQFGHASRLRNDQFRQVPHVRHRRYDDG
jgi:hypothetical protein